MGELSTLDRTGDTRFQWDPANPKQVEEAHQKFNELRKRGYAAFRVDKKNKQGESLPEFDAMEERVIMIPPMVGG
jgi:hypothetical protein